MSAPGAGFMLAVFDAGLTLVSTSADLAGLSGLDPEMVMPGVRLGALRAGLQALQPELEQVEVALQGGGLCLVVSRPMPDARSQFLTTMSHELRTPLNVVIGFADSMLRDPALPREQITEFATAIHQAGQDLLGLINTMLDVARIEQGRFELQADTIDIAYLIGTCASAAQEQARRAGVRLREEAAPGRFLLRADERRLRQILAQLLSNAISASSPGGRVNLTASVTAQQELTLAVEDNGSGLDPDQLAQVFEPFGQADSSLSRRTTGIGLGLHIARALAVAHGGTLTLESTPGTRTIACLTFPRWRLIETTASASLSQETR